jgi:hypothetical protein
MDPETERADPEKLISDNIVASGRQDASEAGTSLSPSAGSGQVLTKKKDEAVDPSAEPKREAVRPTRRLTVKTKMIASSSSVGSAAAAASAPLAVRAGGTSKVRSGDVTPPLTPTRRSRAEASGETGATAGPNPEVDEEVPVQSRRRLDAGFGARAPSAVVQRPGSTCDLSTLSRGLCPQRRICLRESPGALQMQGRTCVRLSQGLCPQRRICLRESPGALQTQG